MIAPFLQVVVECFENHQHVGESSFHDAVAFKMKL